MGNPVIHFEINSPTAPKLHEFYSSIFGWHVDASNPMGYGLVDTHGGRGIGGGIGPVEDGPGSVTWYVGVSDTDEALKRIEALGGKTLMPTTDVMGGQVTIAMFADPDGNAIGLVKYDPSEDTNGQSEGSGAPVEHFEVLGTDGEKLQRFYADAFGWKITDGGQGYGLVEPQDGEGIGGGISASRGDPVVTFYITVTDLRGTLDTIEAAGGKTALEPMQAAEGVEIAAFHDPSGNLVGLARMTG